MKLFGKLKWKKGSWVYYQDVLDGKKLGVKVDRKYVDYHYAHTYLIQIKYSNNRTNELPDEIFIDKAESIEIETIQLLKRVFKSNVPFLGSVSYGGYTYLVFASNLEIEWDDFIKLGLLEYVETGRYINDNMSYYHQVLYPDDIRKEI